MTHHGDRITIPVHDNTHHYRRVLPGAPSVIRGDRFALICKKAGISFRDGVPQSTREDIRKFFQGLALDSVLSIRLLLETEPVGVLNIESSQPAIFRASNEDLASLVKELTFHCHLLAYLAKQA